MKNEWVRLKKNAMWKSGSRRKDKKRKRKNSPSGSQWAIPLRYPLHGPCHGARRDGGGPSYQLGVAWANRRFTWDVKRLWVVTHGSVHGVVQVTRVQLFSSFFFYRFHQSTLSTLSIPSPILRHSHEYEVEGLSLFEWGSGFVCMLYSDLDDSSRGKILSKSNVRITCVSFN